MAFAFAAKLAFAFAAKLGFAVDAAAQQRSVEIPRIVLERDAKVRIDGVIREAVWSRAAELTDFTQLLPVESPEPAHRTRVRIFYDADYLYMALRCFDEPDMVRARLMNRDANLDPDDRVEWWVDTFGDGRFGYWFQIGAGGSRGDALISGHGDRFNKSWDGIWYGKSRLTKDGWEAEVALPFKTLGFRQGATTWGFNIRRLRKENGEEMRWASPSLSYGFFSITRGGTLRGLRDLNQGVGIDFVPYVTAGGRRDRRERKHLSTTGDVGGDLYWRATPELRLVLTYNTDFAETEVDSRQVNLSRFPLFFPEKRDFFLADAGRFEFGIPNGGGTTPIPFFSRRIGLDSSGAEIPLLFGAKAAGSIGPWNVGALGVVTDRAEQLEEKGLGVVRVSKTVGEGSSLGMIGTAGNPTSSGRAMTAGVDAKIGGDAVFGEGKSFYNWAYLLGTSNAGEGGDGLAFGLQSQYRDDTWSHRVRYVSTGSDFEPELGFVRRVGQKEAALQSSFKWRGDGFIRGLGSSVDAIYRTFTDNSVESWLGSIEVLDLELESGDRAEFEIQRFFDRIPERFDIGDSLPILPGDYENTRYDVDLSASDRRALSGSVGMQYGGLYDGTLRRIRCDADLRLNSFIYAGASWSKYRLTTERGDYTTEVSAIRADLHFSPDISVLNLAQYDTASKNLSAQSRLRWIFEPGNELFLLGVYGWERQVVGGPLIPTTEDLTLKLVWTLRF